MQIQHPGVLFIPVSSLDGGDYEINHQGVVLRVRDGKAQHIGGVQHLHEPTVFFDKATQRLPAEYETKEVSLREQGAVVPDGDGKPPGFYLVPTKHEAQFALLWEAEMQRRAAARPAEADVLPAIADHNAGEG